MLRPRPVVNVHPLSSYGFGQKAAKEGAEDTTTVAAQLARLEARYAAEGAQRSVEAVCLVAEHGCPHVLLLSSQSEGGGVVYSLPGKPAVVVTSRRLTLVHRRNAKAWRRRGGRCKRLSRLVRLLEPLTRGRASSGLKRKLRDRLSPVASTASWEVGEVLATWTRPHFTTAVYPYRACSCQVSSLLF